MSGRVLTYYDAKQMEFRVAAYASGDKNMIAVCEDPLGDIHLANAKILFKEFEAAGPETRKGLRDLAKRAVFAVNYFAEAETIYENLLAEGVLITLREVKQMLTTMKRQFPDYYAWQARQLDRTIRTGYVKSPLLGRKRHLGHAPKPTDNANFPIQAGAADVMNEKLWVIEEFRAGRELDEGFLRNAAGDYSGLKPAPEELDALLCSMVYDSATWDNAVEVTTELKRIINEVWNIPIPFGDIQAKFPIDVKTASRWSEC